MSFDVIWIQDGDSSYTRADGSPFDTLDSAMEFCFDYTDMDENPLWESVQAWAAHPDALPLVLTGKLQDGFGTKIQYVILNLANTRTGR